MRYGLRTLLILLGVLPPLIGLGWWVLQADGLAIAIMRLWLVLAVSAPAVAATLAAHHLIRWFSGRST